MKQISIIILLVSLFSIQFARAQRKCGIEYVKEGLIAADPGWEQRIEDQRNSLQGIADAYIARKGAERTTAASAIPVIFHIIITTSQFNAYFGYAGIQERIDSQIAVLNRDYNAQNADSTLIPANWKHLFGNTGIHFGLAHTDPYGFGTPGYELQIIPDSPGGFTGASNAYRDAKHTSSGGLNSWDNTRYLNVWCITPLDATGLLGVTVARSFTTGSGSGVVYPANEIGVCIHWAALGKRTTPYDYYPPGVTAGDYYDQGRTLTHEVGHFFEIWHTWGDDNVYCPWSGPHKDDGIADTPPEGGAKYRNDPYTIAGGTYYDTCRYDGTVDTQTILHGVPCLDYMNYTDDLGMHMFTTQQAAVMSSMVAAGGESYSLTQNPGLLLWSVKTSVPETILNAGVNVYPNPATGIIHISFNHQAEQLKNIIVADITGREVYRLSDPVAAQDYYSIDLSAMSKGIYMVRCTFASGSITRKISLQ